MEPMPRGLKVLNAVTGVLFVIALYLVWFYAPREAVMGEVQRVFYFHVAAGWVGALAFIVAVVAGIAYLRRGDHRWDRVGLASVEIGIVFTLINILSGSIWARPVWNTWWTWDPRLVTATVMELVYIAYVMLRQGIEDPERRARYGAIYAIVGFISVPLTFLSIRIFRTIHPVVIGSGDPTAQGAFDMTPKMLTAFMFSLLTFTFVYATLLWHRLRLEALNERVERRKIELTAGGA
ncbi:MAG TPA: cytochrome c biogenesis protein CcsA [Anaerolineales bacterium]|nr:cytochrome c biogenesis protein CcsA [Anaerolineales bacterium]